METWLPLVNTSLIVVSGASAVTGYACIRRRKIAYHRRAMLTATAFAALFLIVYVLRSLLGDSKLFAGQGAMRAVYLTILGTHTLLAMAIVPLVLLTLSRALRKQFPRHKRIARVTLPIWLYVVVTGWLIYMMLYQLPFTRT